MYQYGIEPLNSDGDALKQECRLARIAGSGIQPPTHLSEKIERAWTYCPQSFKRDSYKKFSHTAQTQSFLFVPIALETLGAIAAGSLEFVTEVGRRLSAATGDVREMAFLFERISVAVQCFSAALIHLSLIHI